MKEFTGRGRALCLALPWLAIVAAAPAAAARPLTEPGRLAAVYDAVLAAQFDSAEVRLAAACPPAPVEACATLRAVNQWWRIALDPHDRSHDDRFERAAADAIALTGRWVEREPRRAEAWFYLAGARAPRVQWLVARGERLAAAREGSRIKDALERALELDPLLHDAHFGIGLYRYYADVAPAALRFFRRFLLLPGGNRVEGLQQMLRTREHGVLLGGEADFQLHWIYLWYERDHGRALDLLRGLDARYPTNPIFLQRIAEVQAEYFGDPAASLAAWETLLGRAAEGAVAEPALAATRARLGAARQAIALGEPDRALRLLDAVIDRERDDAYSARALAHLSAAEAHERRGDRPRARDHYRAAIAAAPERDAAGARARAERALRRNF